MTREVWRPSSIWRYAAQDSLFLPLLALFVLTLFVVPPRGDFPFMDDWLHSKLVQQVLETHRYEGHFFLAGTMVAHILWGSLFAATFGLNYEVLRASTLVLALVGAWVAALCARECGASRRGALLCGALLVANPIYLTMAYTFMNAVPFLTVIALSGLFYLRTLRRDSASDAAIGTALMVLAFFYRQHGPGIALAFAATLLVLRVHHGDRMPRRVIVTFGISGIIGVLLIAGWTLRQGLSASQTSWLATGSGWPVTTLFVRALWFGVVATVYMGLFTLPFMAGRAYHAVSGVHRWSRWRWACFTTFIVVGGLVTLYAGPGMTRLPYLPQVLRDLGTGPIMLTDVWWSNRGWQPVSIGRWWWPITGLALAGAATLFTDLLLGAPHPQETGPDDEGPVKIWRRQRLFLLFWALAYVVGYMPFLPRTLGDRYLLTAMVPAIVFAGATTPFPARKRLAAVVAVPLLVLYGFSLMGLHDYLAWNRARWAGIDHLLNEMGVDYRQIDGGYEYNGTYTSEEYVAKHHVTSFLDSGDRGWWLLGDHYAVSFLPRDGYEEIKRMPYFAWIGMRELHVRILQRRGPGGQPE